LLLGSGGPRAFAADLAALRRVPTPAPVATRAFVERHRRTFAGSGTGWADAQIIHAAAQAGLRVHTADRAVRRACMSVGAALA
jgi:hypothetical protein